MTSRQTPRSRRCVFSPTHHWTHAINVARVSSTPSSVGNTIKRSYFGLYVCACGQQKEGWVK